MHHSACHRYQAFQDSLSEIFVHRFESVDASIRQSQIDRSSSFCLLSMSWIYPACASGRYRCVPRCFWHLLDSRINRPSILVWPTLLLSNSLPVRLLPRRLCDLALIPSCTRGCCSKKVSLFDICLKWSGLSGTRITSWSSVSAASRSLSTSPLSIF